MARVFIPQLPTKWDPVTEDYVALYSVAPARVYGYVIECLNRGVNFSIVRPAAKALREVMEEEKFEREDYLVAIGSPLLIAVSAHIALDLNDGFLNLLTFDRRENAYVHSVIDMTEEEMVK